MGSLSPWHIAVVVIVGLLIFGPKKLPELGRGVGSGLRDFRKGLSGEADDTPAPVVEAASTPVVQTTTAVAAEAPVAEAVPVAEAAAPVAEQAAPAAEPTPPQS
jgi:sec-independent protein translocase protein TatA